MRKATMLLAGAAAAGALIWLATQVTGNAIDTAGDYWVSAALLGAAGFALGAFHALGRVGEGMAPRVSLTALVLGFLPVLVVGSFIVWYGQPDGGWLVGDSHSFADAIGVGGFVSDLTRVLPAIPFGIGLALGLTFDAVPRRVKEPVVERPQSVAFAPAPRATDGRRRTVEEAHGDRLPSAEEAPTHPLSREAVGARK